MNDFMGNFRIVTGLLEALIICVRERDILSDDLLSVHFSRASMGFLLQRVSMWLKVLLAVHGALFHLLQCSTPFGSGHNHIGGGCRCHIVSLDAGLELCR